MENLIFSFNATIPIFLVILVGWILKQLGILNENFVVVSNKLNFNITLPALLFRDMSRANIANVFNLKYLLFCMFVTTICFFIVWGLAEYFCKDKSIIGAFVQASFRGSAAVLGLAFVQNMYNDVGMVPLMILGAVPLYNIYSVIVLTLKSNDSSKNSIKDAFVEICKNPIILSILAGLIVSLLNVSFPVVIEKTIYNFSSIATPLALIAIGAGFEGKKALKKVKPTFIATFIKLILQPALFLPFAIMLGFKNEEMIAILIMLGAPTTVSCYIMAGNMNNDSVLTSSIIVVTTFLSSISLTLWIFILKSLNLI